MFRLSGILYGVGVLAAFTLFTTVSGPSKAVAQTSPAQIELNNLTFTVNGRMRAFAQVVDENGDAARIGPRARCSVQFFANVSENGEETASPRAIGSQSLRRPRLSFVRFFATQLRFVTDEVENTGDNDVVATVQARLRCGRGSNRTTVVSNALARFVICGRFENRADNAERFLTRAASNGTTREQRRAS